MQIFCFGKLFSVAAGLRGVASSSFLDVEALLAAGKSEVELLAGEVLPRFLQHLQSVEYDF
jgi:hypothetical protein